MLFFAKLSFIKMSWDNFSQLYVSHNVICLVILIKSAFE